MPTPVTAPGVVRVSQDGTSERKKERTNDPATRRKSHGISSARTSHTLRCEQAQEKGRRRQRSSHKGATLRITTLCGFMFVCVCVRVKA